MDVVDLCISSDENSRSSSPTEATDDKNRTITNENELGYMSLDSDEDEREVNPVITTLTREPSSGVFSSLETETQNFFNEIYSKNNDKSCKTPPKKCNKKSTNKNECVNGINKMNLKHVKSLNKEQKKILKKAEINKNNCFKPGECMKYITVIFNSLILNESFSASIDELFVAKCVKYKSETAPIALDNCISWTRTSLDHSIDDNGEIIIKSHDIREKFILVFYETNEIAKLIQAKSLNAYFRDLRETTNCQISLLLYGTKTFFRKAANKLIMKENDLDYYLSKLLFEESVSCTKIDSPIDFAQTIFNYTKAIAEIHYKHEKSTVDDQANFFMRGDNKECVQVDKTGNGLMHLWRKTFTKFPLVSLEKAQALCERFSSPQSLIKEINSQSSESAQKMLSDIPIRRSIGPCATTRRIGPELARKIYIYFTAVQGNELLS